MEGTEPEKASIRLIPNPMPLMIIPSLRGRCESLWASASGPCSQEREARERCRMGSAGFSGCHSAGSVCIVRSPSWSTPSESTLRVAAPPSPLIHKPGPVKYQTSLMNTTLCLRKILMKTTGICKHILKNWISKPIHSDDALMFSKVDRHWVHLSAQQTWHYIWNHIKKR